MLINKIIGFVTDNCSLSIHKLTPEFMFELCALSIVSATLPVLFKCYNESEMIFSFWRRLLRKMSENKILEYIAKPLGLCLWCNGFWIAFTIYLTYFKSFDLTFFLYIGINFISIKIFNSVYDNL